MFPHPLLIADIGGTNARFAIVEKEGGIAASNVLLFCDKCGKGVRTVRKTLENGKKLRQCRKCNTQLDK